MGALFDPEQPNTYSRISQLIATYDSYLVGVEPESSLEFITNIYPLRIDLRIIPMCPHESIIRRTEDGRLHMVGSVATWTAAVVILVSTILALYDSCL